MGLKERRKKIMTLMLAACVAGTSTVPVVASDISAFSDGTVESNETTKKLVNVRLIDQDTGKPIGDGVVWVDANAPVMNRNDLVNYILGADSDYKSCEEGDIFLGDSSVTIEVRKPVTNKYVHVIFKTEDGTELGGGDILIDKDKTVISTSELADLITIPGGYEICAPGDIFVGNDSVTIEVRKPVTNKYVHVIFKTEDGTELGGGDILIDKDKTVISTSELADLITIPGGYELCETGDIFVGNDSVTIKVRKIVKTKDITIVYQNRKGKIIDDKNIITVDKNAISVNTGDLTAPKGYTIAITGDITISKNNKVYITVDQNKKAVRIIFKESGKVIDSSKEISVVANAKFVKLSRITAPAGYQIVTTKPNLKISKKNTVTVKVKKLGKTIKVIYRDTTNEIVDTREIVVNKKTTSISSNKIPVPAGYEMLTIGSCSVRTGEIDVYVVKR